MQEEFSKVVIWATIDNGQKPGLLVAGCNSGMDRLRMSFEDEEIDGIFAKHPNAATKA